MTAQRGAVAWLNLSKLCISLKHDHEASLNADRALRSNMSGVSAATPGHVGDSRSPSQNAPSTVVDAGVH